MKKFFVSAVALVLCLTVSSCGERNTLPEDTSAIEQYIAEVSETMRTEKTTTETAEVTTAETAPFEDLSDYDKAIRLAAEYIEHRHKDNEYFLYDFDFDGIPELIENMKLMDTRGWDI